MSFDFEAAVTAPFRMQPGLRRMAPPARHFTALPPGCAAQREKLAVLSAYWPDALAAVPDFNPRTALAAVCHQAAQEHPAHWAWDGETARCDPLGVAVHRGEVLHLRTGAFGRGDEIGRCLSGLPAPWRLPGLLALAFLEDLAVVDGASGSVPWMSVALPSHWSPPHKVGKPFVAIHAPVADNQLLLAASDRLMALVSGHMGAPQRWERFVWNVTSHPRRHAHPDRVDPGRWPEGAHTDFSTCAWWRTERQTFLPIQEADGRPQAVFTIAVEVSPLREALAQADRARRVHAAVASMTGPVLAYRGLQAVREPLLAWLAAQAGLGQAPPPTAFDR